MMSVTSTALRTSRELRRLIGFEHLQPHQSVLRHSLNLTTEAPPPQPPPENGSSSSASLSTATQIAHILKTTEDETWKTDDQLNQLLHSISSSAPSLSSVQFLQITRQLGDSDIAFKFIHYLLSNSSSSGVGSFSSVFQAIFELASREPNSLNKLVNFFNASKELNIPLSIYSAIFLIRLFGRAKLAGKAMLVYDGLEQSLRNTHVRNVLIDLLLRCGRLDDALQVLDEMLQPDAQFPPNENTGEIVFAGLMKSEKHERDVKEEEIVDLVSKLGEFGVFPDSMRLTQMITKFCRRGGSDKAWDLLHMVMKLDGPVEAASCNALLTGLVRQGEIGKMNLLMKEMKERCILPNVVTFGIVINQLCKSRRIDEALEVLEKMKSGENGVLVEPDVVIYNTLIDGLCKIGRQEEAFALLERMNSGVQCVPNTVTYNCLIDGFCKVGELDKACELFDVISEKGVKPNVITVNTLVDGMCRSGRISSALEFFHKMKDMGLEGNAVTYTSLIGALCNVNNINKAMDLFDEMRKKCTPDAIVYYTLISGLSQAGRMDRADSVLSQMKKHGFYPDIGCYNMLISGFCRKNKLDKAYELLNEMKTAGVRPDVVTYNTLVSHFSKKGDFQTALGELRNMLEDGLVPTVSTYGALIHAFCLCGDLNEAMKIFREMSSGTAVPPNTVIYNTLIDALCKAKEVEAALSLLDDMTAKGVRPNSNTFNSIFKGLQDMKWLDKAFELMDRMTEQACHPDYITMEVLTEWFSVVGETDKLRKFIQGYKVSATMA
ncbi:hypothetical protein Ancab_037910 [Ancistrocladus abbreviatus]